MAATALENEFSCEKKLSLGETTPIDFLELSIEVVKFSWKLLGSFEFESPCSLLGSLRTRKDGPVKTRTLGLEILGVTVFSWE